LLQKSLLIHASGDSISWFYSFDLDAVVPGDHLVRGIASVLDLS